MEVTKSNLNLLRNLKTNSTVFFVVVLLFVLLFLHYRDEQSNSTCDWSQRLHQGPSLDTLITLLIEREFIWKKR